MKSPFHCPKCGRKLSNLHYLVYVTDNIHLVGHCEIHERMYVNRVENLPIPTKLSKKAKHFLKESKQPKLF